MQPVDTNARIIATTTANLKQVVAGKKFREDLFSRLGEFMIISPTLRERIEDIPYLAQRFCNKAAAELKKQIRVISADAETLLRQYPWPGNAREQKNVIRRAVLLSEGDIIMPEQIGFLITAGEANPEEPLPCGLYNLSLAEIEKQAIHLTLSSTKGNKKTAAAILDIDYSTLMRKKKKYHITS